jgi:hypothetical protein
MLALNQILRFFFFFDFFIYSVRKWTLSWKNSEGRQRPKPYKRQYNYNYNSFKVAKLLSYKSQHA